MAQPLSDLALHGGAPVFRTPLPYGRQWVTEEDIAAVVAVLRSDWLTTGPKGEEFERAMAAAVGAREAVAVSSGTAALHAAVFALGVGPGDEVIVPAMTFAATANAVLYQGGTPVFADVDPQTLLLDPDQVWAQITPRTKAIMAVDYAGQPCDYDALGTIAAGHGLPIIADASHALGARHADRSVGSLATLTTFSLHPVKHITTGEGGVVTTNDPGMAARMRRFRNHGITAVHALRAQAGTWYYEVEDLGYNYRLTDFQCALGISQLRRLPAWMARRRQIAAAYSAALADTPARPLAVRSNVVHAYHLYVVQLDLDRLSADRAAVFNALRAEGIHVNVHYIPVHLHPLYRRRLGTAAGLCPVAEAAYERILSLPMFPAMTDDDVASVITALSKVLQVYAH